eukprot:2062366-Alexandrium_andersonii.AAC.1
MRPKHPQCPSPGGGPAPSAPAQPSPWCAGPRRRPSCSRAAPRASARSRAPTGIRRTRACVPLP